MFVSSSAAAELLKHFWAAIAADAEADAEAGAESCGREQGQGQRQAPTPGGTLAWARPCGRDSAAWDKVGVSLAHCACVRAFA